MAIGVFFLVILFELANSQLPYQRTCDPIEKSQSPTVCSNYRNIEFVYGEHRKLDRTVLDLKQYAENNNAMLERLERSLKTALTELTRSTETQNSAIQSLRNDFTKLEKHQEGFGVNLSAIEKRLDTTERQLTEKEAKLESLETKTEAAFNDTKAVLNSHKDELSHLSSVTQNLEVQLFGRLNGTRIEQDQKLESITKTIEELTRSTNNHKVDITILKNDVDKLEKHQERFGGNFSDIEKRLDLTERQLMEKKSKLENLETETVAAFNNTNTLLSSYKKELSHLKSTTRDLEIKVEAQLNATKIEIEDTLEMIQRTTDAFSDKLHHQKDDLDHKFTSRYDEVIQEVKTQNATMNRLIGQIEVKLENLEMETEASFNKTETLLETHKTDFSQLNLRAQGLEGKFESGLNSTKTDLEKKLQMIQENTEELAKSANNHKVDITILRNEVDKLEKHQERFGGNFSDIEKRLDVTERQLMEKKARLENLETETVAAFNNTNALLISYKKELSHLKSTAWDLEIKVEARLNATKMEIQDSLETIQKNTEVFSTELHHEKSVVGSKITSLDNSINELKLQNLTVNHLLDQIVVQKRIAFSASIIESSYSFTGPYSPGSSNILKFDRVFTNAGNAYNKKTGIFTAPVDGVYQFSFMTFGYNTHPSGAILMKNGNYQVSTWEFTGSDTSDTTSNSVILEMNAGDCVYIVLWQGGKIHTSVFSGFLIFPLV